MVRKQEEVDLLVTRTTVPANADMLISQRRYSAAFFSQPCSGMYMTSPFVISLLYFSRVFLSPWSIAQTTNFWIGDGRNFFTWKTAG